MFVHSITKKICHSEVEPENILSLKGKFFFILKRLIIMTEFVVVVVVVA